MIRDMAILGAATVILQLASSGAQGAMATESKAHRVHPTRVVARLHEAPVHLHEGQVRRTAMARHASRATFEVSADSGPALVVAAAYRLPAPAIDTSAGAPTSLAYQATGSTEDEAADTAPQAPTRLTDQEREANQLAAARGDNDFLMVDKALGKIILFQNGQPVFSGPALTGQSTADELIPGQLTQKMDDLNALNTKVTPAGRFTVQRGFDKELGGPLLDVSEIRGKDWGIAIHQVYLGTPSEHRDIRIKSPSPEDKHISFGCINVTPSAIKYLLREVPASSPFPLYILPEDPRQTAAYFAPPTS